MTHLASPTASLSLTMMTLLSLFTWTVPSAFGEGGARRDVIRHAAAQTAEAAAPLSLSTRATILDQNGKVMRQGTNGWTCVSDNRDKGGQGPVCMNESWAEFVDALKNQRPPAGNQIGIAYMLRGGRSMNSPTPSAMEAPADHPSGTELGPHMMVRLPNPTLSAGLPTSPEQGGPWVRWAGTPYAHIVIPLESDQAR
ncbi:MAG: hypothetical protein NNA20_02890 [Nitrospira sp.]|nr:hypothetical protein [Nitrospira sp.]MCP9441517.1 hypothetical protein [Nitrospira sp.]